MRMGCSNQCDQIGWRLNFSVANNLTKEVQLFGAFWGYFEFHLFLSLTDAFTVLSTFRLNYISTSGHTGCSNACITLRHLQLNAISDEINNLNEIDAKLKANLAKRSVWPDGYFIFQYLAVYIIENLSRSKK